MNRAKLLGLVLAGAAFALLAAPRAEATPISYSFEVWDISGPLGPGAIFGTFAYDTSSIVSGGGVEDGTGLLTELNFTLNSITYTAATANSAYLAFDSAGDLAGFAFGSGFRYGSICVGVGCGDLSSTEWIVRTDSFLYGASGGSVFWSGYVTLWPTDGPFGTLTAIPEPGSLALLAAALLGLGIAGFARRRAA